MRDLPPARLEDYRRQRVRVNRFSTIQVGKNSYSVSSRLIGEEVEARVYPERVEVWLGVERLADMERLRGSGRVRIDYRHVIWSLVRKPGAFAHYRFQASLFPRLIFRVAYDELRQSQPGQAEREYLQLLQLAATESEEQVATVLRQLVDEGAAVSSARVRELVQARVGQPQSVWPAVMIEAVSLQGYDQLLSAPEVVA